MADRRAVERDAVGRLRNREHRVDRAQQRLGGAERDVERHDAPGAVDAVFAVPEASDGVALDGAAIRHVAARIGQAGIVELWPGAPPPPEESDDPEAEVAPRRAANAHTRLARAVAATIECWLKNREMLPSRDRAVRAGDIMVLVRRRNAFVEDLLRELKQRGVPVAGADRH